ncbi:hypothetical protein CYMTET_50492 [Cymbomonas tetramitiformis]|uniref:Uncharacterized protein n=1 Tax=Cymbomonas tetramitiformis TaxID=36881 RepID=A0AAE0ET37_9CHLO|nr:hypothetical protein CYMTET_50492 [Cymbomonas tetramitiformis]
MAVKAALDARDETDVREQSEAKDCLDTDTEEIAKQETVNAAEIWAPAGWATLNSEMAELTSVLFKWTVRGWQLGRVKMILSRSAWG